MKIKWCLKQSFPLTYRSNYSSDGKQYFSVWKMWFGKCFKHDKIEVVGAEKIM